MAAANGGPPDQIRSSRSTVLVALPPTATWCAAPADHRRAASSGYSFTPLDLAATDGSGQLKLDGSLPRTEAGRTRDRMPSASQLNDLYTLMQRDTTRGRGHHSGSIWCWAGPPRCPRVVGTAALSDFSLGDFGSPFVQAVVNYRAAALDAHPADVEDRPAGAARRGRPADRPGAAEGGRSAAAGPICVRVIADSTDLSLLEAFTRRIRRVRGTMRADVEVEGTWDSPRLKGFLNLQNASAQLPSLGVTYSRIDLSTRFSGDSIAIDTLQVRSGEGSLSASGGLRLEELTRPMFNLTFRARRFRAINQSRFLTLDATGPVTLTGPVHASRRLTGPHHRRPGRAALRRPDQQADRRSRQSGRLGPDRSRPDPHRESRRQFPEPVPRFAARSTTCSSPWARVSGCGRAKPTSSSTAT